MSIAFPTSLDVFTNPNAAGGDQLDTVPHDVQHANANDAIEAIEAILGITNSADSDSINYRMRDIEAGLPYNVAKLGGAVGDGVTNDYDAFATAAASSAKYIIVPYKSSGYYISGEALNLTGKTWISQGGWTKITADSSLSTDLMKIDGADTAFLYFTLDGNYSATSATAAIFVYSGSSNIDLKVRILNAKGYGIYLGGATKCRIRDTYTYNGRDSGIEIDGSGNYGITIDGYECLDNLGMGIKGRNGAHDCVITNAKCTSNGLELIGLTYTVYGFKIALCHAEGTGDNGVSITGKRCILTAITARGNQNNGVWIYGDYNNINGVTVSNNDQAGSGFVGFGIGGGYGGAGSYNTARGIIAFDDQGTPTQQYGWTLSGNNYTAYDNGTAYSAGEYRTNANKCYVSTTSISAGAGAPTHTSGTVGGWLYIFTTTTSFHATGNIIGPVVTNNNQIASFIDNATSGSNYIESRVMGSLFIGTPSDKSYTMVASAPYAGMIAGIKGLATASGTLTATIKINGTNVTGLASLSVTSTPQNATATAANTFAKGDKITITVASSSSPVDLEGTLDLMRAV